MKVPNCHIAEISKQWVMANHSYMKDRLGFDPDELLNEVDDLFHNNPDDDDFESPSHKKFKTYKPSPSSSTSSMLTYESALRDVKGKRFDCVVWCELWHKTCIYINIASHSFFVWILQWNFIADTHGILSLLSRERY